MTAVGAVLIIFAGVSVSFFLRREAKESLESMKKLHEASLCIEEEIRLTRTPVDRIIAHLSLREGFGFLKDSSASDHTGLLAHLAGENSSEVLRYFDLICTSDYEGARSNAELLVKFTEKEIAKMTEKASKKAGIITVLPPAAAFLILLLIL